MSPSVAVLHVTGAAADPLDHRLAQVRRLAALEPLSESRYAALEGVSRGLGFSLQRLVE